MIEKTKLKYVKPHMEIYELRQHPQLLAGSFTGNRAHTGTDPL